MKIVILDALTTNPGDCSWESVAAQGNLTVFDRTSSAEILARADEAEIVLTNKTPLTAETLAELPAVRLISVLATGVNVIDLEAAKAGGITVCNVPGYSTPNVAQAVFALLLELTNRTADHAAAVRAGDWTACPDFCFWRGELVELAGRTLGVVGYGAIGRAVAAIGRAFGMRVLASRRSAATPEEGVVFTDIDSVFRESDVISLHCPQTPETTGLVNAQRLATMKPTAYLINTARGGLVVEQDLAIALNEGRIAGAGLDVLSTEPPSANNPLLEAKNCLITPHIAWATRAARERLIAATAENIRSFLAGTPQNVVG
ncbi:MAG: D-2-hydroxyacid dehydrogenase [Planctomycetia bacterium]|nr:D-2-hydroxyacid dehydrogenase [Planctomycetia bacterium]